MANLPKILVLVHSPAVGEAMAADDDAYAMQWSLNFGSHDLRDESAVVAQVADLHPALIVVELDAPAKWLAQVHSDPATRRIPIVAIAADEMAHQRADAAHIEVILTPEQFIAGLPGILSQYAKVYAQGSALNSQCQDSPPPPVKKSLTHSNNTKY